MKKIKSLLPGILLSFTLAFVALRIEASLPVKFIGASVIALLVGMAINPLLSVTNTFETGFQFTSKRILKFAIVLLGASLDFTMILSVGKMSLLVMLFTLATCFGGGYFIGKALGLNWKLSNLISAGTGICGGSAIAAIAPAIDAPDKDIAYAMSATFLFDIAMIVLFPIMGKALGLSDIAYGLWTGTAVNDTSSVVAAGYAFSEAAGDFATMVKLTRTLAIIPTVLIFSMINQRISTKHSAKRIDLKKSIPWFIVGFIAMSSLKTTGLLSIELSQSLKIISKFLMVAALASIGLNTRFKSMIQTGFNPFLHGFIISTLVVVVALVVEMSMGII